MSRRDDWVSRSNQIHNVQVIFGKGLVGIEVTFD
jgi:hypothetical protein